MKKRPLCQWAAAFVCGLLLVCTGIPPWAPAPFLLLPALLALKRRRWGIFFRALPVFASFLAGALVMCRAAGGWVFSQEADIGMPDGGSARTESGASPGSALREKEGGPVTVRGRLVRYEIKNDTVYYYIKTTSRYHQVMVTKADQRSSFYTGKNQNISPGQFQETTTEQMQEAIGMHICASGTLSLFRQPKNPGQFHQQLYYKSMNVDFAVQNAQITITDSRQDLFAQWLKGLQIRLSARMNRLAGEKDGPVLAAMLFGDKTGLSEEIKQLYQRNGIAHVLAISGLHISFLGMCVYRLLRKCGCPVWLSGLSGSVFTFCFGMLTGMSVSALRAVVMYLVSMGARVWGRTYDMASALSLAAVLVLADRPFAVFQPSMQYSFCAILAILFLQILPVRKWKAFVPGKLFKGLFSSAVIQFVTLPVQLYHSFYLPVYACLLNVAVIPAMGLVLLSGMGAAAASFFCRGFLSGLPGLLLMPGRLLLRCFEKLCLLLEGLPGNLLVAGRPSLPAIFLFCLLLFLWACLQSREKKLPGRWLLPVLGGVMLILPHSFKGLEITMLDMGQGEAVCFQLPDKSCILSDGGSIDESRTGSWQIRPFLLSRGISEIKGIFISHWDEDHISGVRELLEQNGKELTIRRLILPDAAAHLSGDGTKLSSAGSSLARGAYDPQFDGLMEAAEQAGVPVQFVQAGDRFVFSEVSLVCLSPGEGERFLDRNSCSAAYILRYGSFSMALTGDLPVENEEALLEKGLPSCQVLKVAHHGSKGSTSQAFLEQVRPLLSLISCGENNRYGHPAKELLERLQKAGSAYYCTKDVGAVCLQVRPDGKCRIRTGYDSPFNTIFKMLASTSMAFSSS